MDAVVHEEPLEGHDLFEESRHLGVGGEPHDALDAGPVVPGPIEERDLTARGELFDVPLEVPLSALGLVGDGKGNVASGARVHVLAHALDRAALAGRVAPLEEQEHTLAARRGPLLHLHQFDLEREQAGRVVAATDLLGRRKDGVTPLVTRKRLQEGRVEVIHQLTGTGCLGRIHGRGAPRSTATAPGEFDVGPPTVAAHRTRCALGTVLDRAESPGSWPSAEPDGRSSVTGTEHQGSRV